MQFILSEAVYQKLPDIEPKPPGTDFNHISIKSTVSRDGTVVIAGEL